MNAGTADLVHYASKVSIATTPELPALTLAAQRLSEVLSRGLDRRRASVIVNRWHRGDLGTKEIEAILKLKVATVLGNDYRSVQRATLTGSAVNSRCDLAKSFRAFAGQLLEKPRVAVDRSRILLEAWPQFNASSLYANSGAPTGTDGTRCLARRENG